MVRFHQMDDIQSMQKRFRDKERRRLQKHISRAQQKSKDLQQSLNRPDDTSQSSEVCDVHIVSQTHDVDALFSPDGSELFATGATSNIVNTSNLPVVTEPSSNNGDSTSLSGAPRFYDFDTANGFVSSDPWPHTFPNTAEPFRMLEWSFPDPAAADRVLDGCGVGPACAYSSSSTNGAVTDGLVGPTMPTQTAVIPVRDVTDMDPFLLYSENDLVAQEEPPETTVTHSFTPGRESEASTIVHEAPTEAAPAETNALEVLIRAQPPQDATKYTAIPDYPTPFSDHGPFPVGRSSQDSCGRKRARASGVKTRHDDEDEDEDEDTASGLRRSKRRCDGTNDDHRRNNSVICRQSTSPRPTRTAERDAAHSGSPAAEGNRTKTTSAPKKHETSAMATPHVSASSVDSNQALVPTATPWDGAGAASLPAGTHAEQACTSCGVNRAHLLQLSQSVLRWAESPDNASLEALLMNGAPLNTRDTQAILLHHALGALRDYVLDPIPGHDTEPPAREESRWSPDSVAPNKTADSVFSDEVESAECSDSDDFSDDSNVAGHSLENDNKGYAMGVGLKNRGQRGRWSELEERRLRAFVVENMSWSQIGKKLNRSESAVLQHWRIMERR